MADPFASAVFNATLDLGPDKPGMPVQCMCGPSLLRISGENGWVCRIGHRQLEGWIVRGETDGLPELWLFPNSAATRMLATACRRWKGEDTAREGICLVMPEPATVLDSIMKAIQVLMMVEQTVQAIGNGEAVIGSSSADSEVWQDCHSQADAGRAYSLKRQDLGPDGGETMLRSESSASLDT